MSKVKILAILIFTLLLSGCETSYDTAKGLLLQIDELENNLSITESDIENILLSNTVTTYCNVTIPSMKNKIKMEEKILIELINLNKELRNLAQINYRALEKGGMIKTDNLIEQTKENIEKFELKKNSLFPLKNSIKEGFNVCQK